MIETTRGGCAYCGQLIELELEYKPETTADAKATMLCTCTQAKAFQKNFQDEITAIQRREDTLRNAKEAIRKVFAEPEDKKHAAMSETVVEFLFQVSAMVYDGMIGGTNLNLAHGTKAKIAKKKGGLKIERQNTDGESIEI